MRRDPDLIREILLRAEDAGWNELHTKHFPERQENVVAYHMQLLEEAGYLRANLRVYRELGGAREGSVVELTWHGHEFLDAIRDESRWSQAKAIAAEKAGSATWEVVKTVATALWKAKLKESLGLSD